MLHDIGHKICSRYADRIYIPRRVPNILCVNTNSSFIYTMTISIARQDVMIFSIFTASFTIIRVTCAAFRVICTYRRQLVNHQYMANDLLLSTLFLVPVLLVPILNQFMSRSWELKGTKSTYFFYMLHPTLIKTRPSYGSILPSARSLCSIPSMP
jgi:hypothetical protein